MTRIKVRVNIKAIGRANIFRADKWRLAWKPVIARRRWPEKLAGKLWMDTMTDRFRKWERHDSRITFRFSEVWWRWNDRPTWPNVPRNSLTLIKIWWIWVVMLRRMVGSRRILRLANARQRRNMIPCVVSALHSSSDRISDLKWLGLLLSCSKANWVLSKRAARNC